MTAASKAQVLKNKHILVGITGSIAAYKSADLVRRLREQGAVVRVAMTENAKRFITPLTMQALSGFPVHDELFDLHAEAAMGHIELARWADLILIAPASADCIARLANGEANDLLSALVLATAAPVVLAPAMNQGMWKHTLTQKNLQSLRDIGVRVLATGEGSQACGDVGPGRMLEPLDIIAKLTDYFSADLLAGVSMLITAGPTHEALDPVRFLMNDSSGKMGYALCQAALAQGARVILISGPVNLAAPAGAEVINVISAQEMHASVMQKIKECDIFLGVAAVCDYRADKIAAEKIAKQAENLHVSLTRNPDIISAVARLNPKPFVVGFAAETNDLIAHANAKRERKKMDMIIANLVGKNLAMGTDDNEVIVISAAMQMPLPRMPKVKLAEKLITIIADQFKKRPSC